MHEHLERRPKVGVGLVDASATNGLNNKWKEGKVKGEMDA